MLRPFVAAVLLLGACFKSAPDTSTASPASAAPAAIGTPAEAASAASADEHSGHRMPAMPAGMPMPLHDGGMPMQDGGPMGHPMPGHPM